MSHSCDKKKKDISRNSTLYYWIDYYEKNIRKQEIYRKK